MAISPATRAISSGAVTSTIPPQAITPDHQLAIQLVERRAAAERQRVVTNQPQTGEAQRLRQQGAGSAGGGADQPQTGEAHRLRQQGAGSAGGGADQPLTGEAHRLRQQGAGSAGGGADHPQTGEAQRLRQQGAGSAGGGADQPQTGEAQRLRQQGGGVSRGRGKPGVHQGSEALVTVRLSGCSVATGSALL